MENAITIISKGQFKSKALNTATAGLFKAFQNIESGKKDACAILAKVEKNKSYKEDGFNSLAEYGAAIGLGDKSLVHKMENAGRLLISEVASIKDFADKADYSKLSILCSTKPEDLKSAIESGEITPDMKQTDVKSWKATKAVQAKGDKVLPKFEVQGVRGNGDHFHYDAVELENIEELSDCVKVGTFAMYRDYDGESKISEDGDKWTVYGNVNTGELIRIMYTRVKATKKQVTKPASKMTKEELIAMAEAMGMKVTF